MTRRYGNKFFGLIVTRVRFPFMCVKDSPGIFCKKEQRLGQFKVNPKALCMNNILTKTNDVAQKPYFTLKKKYKPT